MTKPLILILCTGNSCRSQMAEGFLKEAGGDLFEVYSAGSDPAGYVHPKAIAVMREAGINLLGHESKSMHHFLNHKVNTVITVCDAAAEACPLYPDQENTYHWTFTDPAKVKGSEEEVLAAFREVRDRIRMVIQAYVAGYRQAVKGSAAR
jgi:arsenate reductase